MRSSPNDYCKERWTACDARARATMTSKSCAFLVASISAAARMLAASGNYDAIICLGCLLRGDTAHYDVIVNECARGIGQSAQETGVPHAFGVLTCDTLEQAVDRAGLKMGNKGLEAALTAVEMANLKSVVSRQSSVSAKTARRKSSSASKGSHNSRPIKSNKSSKKRAPPADASIAGAESNSVAIL